MKYDELLVPARSGVYATPGETAPLRAAAQAAGLQWVDLDLAGVRDREGFLARCAETMALPGYFGKNWDALHECLVDAASGAARGMVVHWRGGAELARRSPDAIATALEVLRDAAMYWRGSGRTWIAIVDGDSAAGIALPALLENP